MSNQSKRRPPTKAPSKSAPRNRTPARATAVRRPVWIAAAVVVVIGAAAAIALTSGHSSGAKDEPASASLVSKVTTIPAHVFATVGRGTANPLPQAIQSPTLTEAGKPEVLYVGAEYCPYCATERWAMVVALSRFGSFSGLHTTHSSTTDVFADTKTFSFHGATYRSPYLAFTGLETQTNVRQGDGYTALDKLTSEQQQIYSTYGRGIPFIDFGGKYLVNAVTYDPSVLQGKSVDEIATALRDPTSAIARGAIGSANALTAAICKLTGSRPASVCASPAITQIQASL